MPASRSIRHLFKVGRAFRIGLILLLAGALSRSGTSAGVFTQEAYIWQRDWTPALVKALRESSDLVAGWRVLAAETDGQGRLFEVPVDWAALRDSERPITLVLRINDRLDAHNEAELIDRFSSITRRWARNLPRLRTVEIDYDCGTARLGSYTRFLTRFRERIDPSFRLSVTALPTWLSSPDLGKVLDATDGTVLQIHAVRDAHAGLIDQQFAIGWVHDYARRDSKPFQVALPAYGLRVNWADDGSIASVEGETPRLGGSEAEELLALPADMAKLAAGLRTGSFANLMGIVWFRLPTANDNRAWSLATWRAVVTGREPASEIVVVALPATPTGSRSVHLVNRGGADGPLPASIRLPERCAAADGINGYALEYRAAGLFLGRIQAGLMRPGQEREIGWLRCADSGGDVHVQE